MSLKRLAAAALLILFLNLAGRSAETYLIDSVHRSKAIGNGGVVGGDEVRISLVVEAVKQ